MTPSDRSRYLSLVKLDEKIREAMLGLEPESRIPLQDLQTKVRKELKQYG
ncbi:MAG TPA: hypothetical protein VJ742_12400 [Nitrososphaera sp.]|nr:hypothetical protein [Nitrososphaera sp.]